MMRRTRDPIDRFREKIAPEGDCLIWTGSTNGNGYGMFYVGPRRGKIGAHVYAYLVAYGPVPEGREVHHSCNRPECVNPQHLVAKTRAAHNVETFGGKREQCAKGHEMTPENTYIAAKRECRKCRAARQSAKDRQRRARERGR